MRKVRGKCTYRVPVTKQSSLESKTIFLSSITAVNKNRISLRLKKLKTNGQDHPPSDKKDFDCSSILKSTDSLILFESKLNSMLIILPNFGTGEFNTDFRFFSNFQAN